MSLMQEFEELRRSSEEEERKIRQRFVQVNPDPLGEMERLGFSLSYTREHDHLYVTFGEPREGMAIFSGSVVLIVDPETVELLGVEIPGFKEAIESGAVGDEWALLARLIGDKAEIRVPPARKRTPSARKDEDAVPQDRAQEQRMALEQALERELAVA